MDRELWPRVAGGAAQWLTINQLAKAVEKARFGGGDPDLGERTFEIECGEFAGCMR